MICMCVSGEVEHVVCRKLWKIPNTSLSSRLRVGSREELIEATVTFPGLQTAIISPHPSPSQRISTATPPSEPSTSTAITQYLSGAEDRLSLCAVNRQFTWSEFFSLFITSGKHCRHRAFACTSAELRISIDCGRLLRGKSWLESQDTLSKHTSSHMLH